MARPGPAAATGLSRPLPADAGRPARQRRQDAPGGEASPPASADLLAADRPWADPGFWLLQVGVLVLFLVRVVLEITISHDIVPHIPDFTTTALFLPPVLYAAITYGPTGGVTTAAWVLALGTVRAVAYVRNGDGVGAWAEDTQIIVLCVIAIVVGRRVAAERVARLQAEESRQAHLDAESRYRSLFASNAAPILLVDPGGVVVEMNAAAEALLGPGAGAPVRLEEFVGREAGDELLAAGGDRVVTAGPESAQRRFRALVTDVSGGVDRLRQIVLNDVTPEVRRQQWMEGYAASVVQAQEEERRRLAQELHDGPLQALVHLSRLLDREATPVPAPAPAGEPAGPASGPGRGDGGAAEDLRELTLRTIDELRDISRGLRPSILDDLGLQAAVGRLLEELRRRVAVTTHLEVEGDARRLSGDVELALFRLVQEALSNVEHHAAADRVAVTLDFTGDAVVVSVTDDGRGFDATAGAGPPRPGSMGLVGMAERVHLLGGRLQVDSAPGVGTTVSATVPGS